MLLAGAGLLGVLSPQARADVWNQRTTFTFSGPVEVPGKVLPAGTYVFKLLDSPSDRNIVQVFDKNQQHLYATFLTVADYRLKTPGKTILTFEERAANSPEAVRAWFYPGDNYGHQFVYPKEKAMSLAKANNTPVPSMPENMAANTTQPAPNINTPSVQQMQQAPLKAQKPSQDEVELVEIFPPQQSTASQSNQSQSQSPAPTQTEARNRKPKMPETASQTPLIGLIGLLSIGFAFSLRFATAKVK